MHFLQEYFPAIISLQLLNFFLAGWFFGEEKKKQDAFLGVIFLSLFGFELVILAGIFIAFRRAYDWIGEVTQFKFYYGVLVGDFDVLKKGNLDSLNYAVYHTKNRRKLTLFDNAFIKRVAYLSKLHNYNCENENYEEGNYHPDWETKSTINRSLLPWPFSKMKSKAN